MGLLTLATNVRGPVRRHGLGLVLGILALAGLWIVSRYSYLLFHCVVEAFVILVGLVVFTVFWHTRRLVENGFYLVLGLGCLFAAIVDLISVLAHLGVLLFSAPDASLAFQIEIAEQAFLCVSCAAAFSFLKRHINGYLALLIYLAVLAIWAAGVFYWRVFPACDVPGVGITAFARVSLVASCGMYLLALVRLAGNRREFDGDVFRVLVLVLVAFVLENATSAAATARDGLAETISNLCEVVAIAAIYKALVEIGLGRPYDLLLRRQRESEERYRLVVETIPQLAWRNSPDGKEAECNRRWYEYTGQRPDQVAEGGWQAAVHPDDVPHVQAAARRAMERNEPYDVEVRLRRASDGAYRWHLARGRPVLDERGKVVVWVGSATDIEDLKQAQEILRLAHDEELQRHQAELTHVARLGMIGEMAASLAHELGQPLHAVTNYAYGGVCRLDRDAERDEQLVDAFRRIGEEANRAAEILRRVKAFVQKRAPRYSAVAVNTLVDDALLLMRMDLQRYRVQVVRDLAGDLPPVTGDPIQIEQVIMNLIRNGMEAMDESPHERRLVVRTCSCEDRAVQVDVVDAGKGIPAADLEKVFEPFFTTKAEGMGMGLAISRSLVQAHGGNLWATANAGRGCTFHFTLPTKQATTSTRP